MSAAKSTEAYGMYGRYIPLFIELHLWKWKVRVGFEYSEARTDTPYLDRWIVYLGPINLRLHKFHRGDDDRAPHNHPWWFITFPLTTYYEKVETWDPLYRCWAGMKFQLVKRFKFHFRGTSFKHIVYGRILKPCAALGGIEVKDTRPFYTIVIAGDKSQDWGFWPIEPISGGRIFVPFTKWRNYVKEHGL